MEPPSTVAELAGELRRRGYLADDDLAAAAFLALRLQQPLLLEGEAGVGKTYLAQTMANVLGRDLIRVQCFEGVDRFEALYDWDYRAQLLATKSQDLERDELYSQEFLLAGPLLRALRSEEPVVLLIDEIDRADEEFEAFLLEVLGEFQVTIPELGTVRGAHKPLVFLTSNRTRELHGALKRRCLYHWIDFPTPEREREILELAAPASSEDLRERIARAAAALRDLHLYKAPGVGETISWAHALLILGSDRLGDGLGAAIKVREDLEQVRISGVLERI